MSLSMFEERILAGLRHRELIDQPVAEMHHVAAAAAVDQHVLLVAGEPGVEAVEQRIHRRARDQLAVLRAENADRGLAAIEHVENLVVEQRLEDAVAGAEDNEIVALARRRKIAEGEMMDVGGGRQQRVDDVVAEPIAEIADVVVGDHRDVAGRRHDRAIRSG